MPTFLSEDEARRLLDAAAEAIRAEVEGRATPRPPAGGALEARRGVFATLTKNGRLRGCIGTIEASEPLGRAALRAARDAAFHDPRFPPMTVAELPGTDLALSILTPPLPARPEELAFGRHGVVLALGARRAVYLPDVWPQLARETGDDSVEGFLSHLARYKAGLDANAWRDPRAALYAFETEKYTRPL